VSKVVRISYNLHIVKSWCLEGSFRYDLKERFTIPRFDYCAPGSVSDAVRILGKYGKTGSLLAGGTALLVDLKRGDQVPPKMMIDIGGLRALDFVKFNQRNGLRIGALTRLSRLLQSQVVQRHYPAIADAIRGMGTAQVCNMATVGGNLGGGSPCSDLAVPFLVLGARLTLRRHRKERRVAIEDLYIRPYKTCLNANEMLTEIEIPCLKNSGMAFERFGRTAVDLGLAKVAILIRLGADRKCSLFRLAIGTAMKIPKRIENVEKLLTGKTIDATWSHQIAKMLEDEEYVDDWRASSDYRLEICKVLTKRALEKAVIMAEAG